MIYDCFPFFNELEILEIRLHTLDAVVDKFVIVESTKTFQSNPKPLYFQEYASRFRQFQKKIIHIVDSKMPIADDSWLTYRHQLNCIHNGLIQCGDNDIISISDVDEIPNPDRIREFDPAQKLKRLNQRMFYYYLNCETFYNWSPGYITPYSVIKDVDLLDVRDRKIGGDDRLSNGGWHFSYVGGTQRIIAKLEAFSHKEYNSIEFKDPVKLLEHLNNKTDLFGRESDFKIVQIDSTFPQYIQDCVSNLRLQGLIA
jgi:beta-1,4-mannosyl-glycoprotein beta-1,4-N-acetylglucosaminyltransferase